MKVMFQKIYSLSTRVKIILIIILAVVGWFGYQKYFVSSSQTTQYQTEKAERGTLIVSVTASGQVSAANNAEVTTQASGVVKQLYVKDGDEVKAGDKIADIDLDIIANQKAAQALASYQNAKNTVDNATASLYTLRSDMLAKWDTYMEKAQTSTYENTDKSPKTSERQLPDFMTTSDDWLASEAKYKNQQGVIMQAQTALSSAWYNYQQASPTVYAPISGTVTGLSLQIGSVITAQQASSSNSNPSQKIASIKTSAQPIITVNLTEIDVPKVKISDKATVTFDALPDKTFTGHVVSLDTIGSVSSGVTTYPAVIQLDTQSSDILPNMAASANIITQTKTNVLMVSSTAVQTTDGESTVQVMRNGIPQQVQVETGLSSDTHIEITSGLNEGDEVVTSTINSSSTSTSSTQSSSPFSALNRNRGGFGGGGANVRVIR